MADTAVDLFDAIEDYVARAVAPLLKEVADLRTLLANVPAGPPGDPGKDAEPVDYARIDGLVDTCVKSAVAGLPPPVNGKDASPEAIRASVEAVIASWPRPKDGEPGQPGKSAEIDYDRVSSMLKAMVSALPVAKDGAPGKDATPVDPDQIVAKVLAHDRLGEMVSVAVAKDVANAVSQIKVKDGTPGKDAVVDYGIVREFSEAVVVNKWAQMPKPVDGNPGKDADEDAITTRVLGVVMEKINAIPIPKDGEPGKDADIGPVAERLTETVRQATEQIPEVVQRAVDALPKPKNGEPGKDGNSVTAEDIRPLISVEVKTQVDALPRPENGKSITVEDVRPMLEKMVAAIEIPQPKNGEPGKDADEGAITERVIAIVNEKLDDFVIPKDGKDADEDAIVERVLARVPIPKDAEPIAPEAIRVMVMEEVRKEFGNVRLPKDGEPGRDSIAAAILRGIDEGRSYPVNTYASHRGAFMVSERQTSPVGDDGLKAAGWLILSDAAVLKDVTQDANDPRKFHFKEVMASGTVIEKTFSIPCIIDKGAWISGCKYEAGDVVSYDGSMFIARRDNATRPREDPADWRLAVKRGNGS